MDFRALSLSFVMIFGDVALGCSIDSPQSEATIEAVYHNTPAAVWASQPAPLRSRLIKTTLRFMMVAGFTGLNILQDPASGLKQSIGIGVVAGGGSGTLSFFNHYVQSWLANTTLTNWIVRCSGQSGKSRLIQAVRTLEELARGYTLDVVYLTFTNTGIYLVDPNQFPTYASFFAATFGLSFLAVLSQTIAEISYAKQVRLAKENHPDQAVTIQAHADSTVTMWSVMATGFTVGAVRDIWYCAPALYGMAILGSINYIYYKLQHWRRRTPKDCVSAFFAPWRQ